MTQSLQQTLAQLGYKLEDDAWQTNGRRTYSHFDDATAELVRSLRPLFGALGFERARSQLRAFTNSAGDMLELEPGGADTSGHYLHHLRGVLGIDLASGPDLTVLRGPRCGTPTSWLTGAGRPSICRYCHLPMQWR